MFTLYDISKDSKKKYSEVNHSNITIKFKSLDGRLSEFSLCKAKATYFCFCFMRTVSRVKASVIY